MPTTSEPQTEAGKRLLRDLFEPESEATDLAGDDPTPWITAILAIEAEARADSPDLRAVVEALRHIRRQIVGTHPGYAGDHYVWTVQFNQASIDRIDDALRAAQEATDGEPDESH